MESHPYGCLANGQVQKMIIRYQMIQKIDGEERLNKLGYSPIHKRAHHMNGFGLQKCGLTCRICIKNEMF